MDFNTRDRMDAQIYTHSGHNSEELVFGIRDAQGDEMMGRVDPEV